MSTTRGVRTLVGTALASSIILLGGCSSSGTTNGATGGSNPLAGTSTTHSAAGTTGGTSGGSSSSSDSSGSSGGSSSSDSSGTTGGSSGGLGLSDPGCQAALTAAENAMSGVSMTDPNSAKNALLQVAGKMHTAAGQSKIPAAATAINKVADDYSNIANSLGSGKAPDTSSVQTDATAMGTACAGG
jgi:hypothetical protein